MGSSRDAWLGACAIAGAVVAVDQGAKLWIRGNLMVGERRNGFALLDIVRVNNKGVAFGALDGGGWMVPVLAAVATLGVLIWFWRNSLAVGAWLPAGLVLGGAVGNFVDRLARNQVTDFIKLPHWPAFNLADISISVGVLLLVLVAEMDSRRTGATDGD